MCMKITTCLLVLLNQSRDNACESVSSSSAYGRSLVNLEKISILYDFHGPTIGKTIHEKPKKNIKE